MSFLNKIFQSVPVEIPDRSGFDLSHEVLSTAKCGTVAPITHFEVLPGDTISMGSLMKVTLPPMAVPFMGRIDAELTAAFIPNRLLWKGWQSFITRNNGTQLSTVGQDYQGIVSPGEMPPAYTDNGIPLIVPMLREYQRGAGTLADYLGVNIQPAAEGLQSYQPLVNALPFLAYQKFCDDWIRDDNLMKPYFPKNPGTDVFIGGATFDTSDPRFLPFSLLGMGQGGDQSTNGLIFFANTGGSSDNASFDASLTVETLRQRCWAKDYFTTATTRPQAGAESSVFFNVSGTADLTSGDVGASGQFTIATLRAANALQKWMERNNIAGTEYGDQIMAHFGVRPPDAVLNRSVLLGSVRTPVYVGGIENNTGNAQAGGTYVGTKSPYGNVLGSAAGFGSAGTDGTLIDNFTAKEHGYIMVFFTLIPHAYYSSGILRSNMHRTIGDYAFPEFAGIGDQAIYATELSSLVNSDPGIWSYGSVFGYNQRYSEYKFLPDRISGLVRGDRDDDPSAPGSLSAYALQRSFTGTPVLGSQFLEIPTDYLDQVLGVNSQIGGFGCMIDAWFDVKALRILPEFSLPHL